MKLIPPGIDSEDNFILLRKKLDPEGTLSPQEWDGFAKIWQTVCVNKKQIITVPGTKEKYLYFVLEGVQRVYSITNSNKESTLIFTYGSSFGGVLDSFLLQRPSSYFYETLTPSTFLRAPFSSFEATTKISSKINRLIQLQVYEALSGLLSRISELQILSSTEKFKTLLKRSPHLLQLVPHKYIASYLGIDATNFSKLINKIVI